MTTKEWDEIKKLAADFQRTQMSSSMQRLGDRNCIEIVKKLIELDLIQVIYTCDGKEYLTPEHLQKEIEDELIVNGGRVELTDLVSVLNVDLVHIEARAGDLVRHSSKENEISFVQGRLISREYKDKLAEEINEKLCMNGIVTVGELTKTYDLPSDFIDDIISSRLGTIIKGSRDANDSRSIFTELYIDSYRCKIRGALLAITKPTTLTSVMNRFKFPEKIFQKIVDELVKNGSVKGSISSSKVFTPETYVKSQQEWVDNFYDKNGLLEYESLPRLGITDGKSYITKRFPEITHLKTCGVSKNIVGQAEAAIEESILNKEFLDISSILPSVLSPSDIQLLVEKVTTSKKSLEKSIQLLCECFVVPTDFIESFKQPLIDSMPRRAEEDLKSGKLFQIFANQALAKESAMASEENASTGKLSRKEERKKKSTAKVNTGGGTQGREVKIKATKKKYNPRDKKARDDSDEECNYDEVEEKEPDLIFMSVEELNKELLKLNPELAEVQETDLVTEISSILFPFLNSKYRDIARQVFVSSSSETDGKVTRKKTLAELSSSLTTNYALIHLYSRGLETVSDETLKQSLMKYLQKSLCSDTVNLILHFLLKDENVNLSNSEARVKAAGKLDPELKESIVKLNSTLTSSSMDEYIQQLEACASACCDILLKPVDKKREKVLLSESRQNLLHQMRESTDPALKLHTIVLLIYQSVTGQAIHSSGKFVPQLITSIKSKLDEQVVSLLTGAEEAVVSLIKLRDTEQENEKEEIEKKLNEELIPKLENFVTNFKSTN